MSTMRAALAGLALCCVWATWAHGEESSYCRKVRARAQRDAALLLWPKLMAEAVRFPSLAEGLGPTLGGTGVQVRLGASISLIDIVRGARLGAAADAECELHEVSEVLRSSLLQSADEATQASLDGQVAFLRAHRQEWEALLEQAGDRLDAGVITIIELEALRRAVIELERKLALSAGEAERLGHTLGRSTPASAWGPLARRYVEGAMGLERHAEGARALGALHVGLTGGVIPGFDRPSEWFGLFVISYQLGGLFGMPASRRYLEARQEELEHADEELPAKASQVQLEVGAKTAKAWRELQVVEGALATTTMTLEALAGSSATIAEHARATVRLEQVSLESDRIYLSTLIERLSCLSTH